MSDTTPNRIALIGEQIRTQDNSSTADPLFVVYQKRRIYGMDPEYVNPVIWLHCDGDEANEQQAKDLEADYNKTLEEPDDWTRTGYVDVDVFCTACLTRKGCEDYLDAYGHNLERPFIDVDTLRRNEEMIAVRDCLGVATPEPVAVLSAVSPSKTTEDAASITNAEADAAYAEFDAEMKAKKRAETRMAIKNAALITNAGLPLGYFTKGGYKWWLTEVDGSMLTGVDITPKGKLHTLHINKSEVDSIVLMEPDRVPVPDGHEFILPFICPACRSNVRVRVTGAGQREDGTYKAESIDCDCERECNPDGTHQEEFRQHHERILAYLNKRYDFPE